MYTEKLYGYRFRQYISSVGWDKSDCWFAHCCMLNEDEIAMFAANGIGVAHCPSSNTRLASGIAPVRYSTAVQRIQHIVLCAHSLNLALDMRAWYQSCGLHVKGDVHGHMVLCLCTVRV